jgi:hypothetical protein
VPSTPPIAGAEDRQQRPIITESDDDEIEHYQGENDRFGEKEFDAAQKACQRKIFFCCFVELGNFKQNHRHCRRDVK